MRISTSQLYSQGADAIGRNQSELFANQQRIASGKRMLAPSDDPIASAEAVVVGQSKARVERFGANLITAAESLGLNDSILADVGDTLIEMRTLAINGGAGSLSDADRRSLATDLEGRLQQLVGLANSRGADGGYLFGGFAVGTQPFALVGGSYAYQGDQGQRALTVADGRDLPVSENGEALFNAVRTGNGTFIARAAATNAGAGIVAAGSVTDPTLLDGHGYRLHFNVAAGVTTYDVVDVTAATTVSTGNAYVPGSAIAVAGMQVTITGDPLSGDQFTLTPSGHQSVFTTVQELIATLRAPTATAGDKARLGNGLNLALQNLSQAQEAVLTTRAGLGARMRELDSLAAHNEARTLQYEATLSRLQDLDYSKALSDFARQQLALEASQKSFLQVSGLSLFNYL
ncbi:MAG: flagellar hook-associated protein FlgL [Betaproteobacteria bacterium]|nr:flagellar hook-associated protein FlgL [Betaproteobacteria bacterium]MBK7080930.1 flagellar hook-associated protein FlgL [Betaproteobacteria bacterium]MBK8687368.1 flagellar hook-associated protein FlgL [Betaproteobacteria bacterium]